MHTTAAKAREIPATRIIPDMSLVDLIYSKTGISIGLDSVAADFEAQTLIASLLTLVANSDGGISPDESLRMVQLLRSRFQLREGEALNMITRASDELATHTSLDEILISVNDNLDRKSVV